MTPHLWNLKYNRNRQGMPYNTREFEPGIEPYVLPIQCEQVFYSEMLGKVGCSYIVRYDPRGRPIKYNAPKEEDNVEEEDDANKDQMVVDIDVSDEESDQEDDLPNDVVENDIVSDDIDDEYITKNDIDEDVDMSDPFNNSDSELGDGIDVESYEEEYRCHCSNVGI